MRPKPQGTPGHRLRFKWKAALDEAGAVPSPVEEEDPADAGLGAECQISQTHCYCRTCGQNAHDFEMDLLPEQQQLIQWAKKNKTQKGGLVRTGFECQPCFLERRCAHSLKPQSGVLEQLEKSRTFKEDEMMRCRRLVRGERRFGRKVQSSTTQVVDEEANYGDNYDEGVAYFVDDYLKANRVPLRDFKTMAQKVDYIRTEMQKVVQLGDDGQWVVMESQLLAGAAYKWKKGKQQSTKLVDNVQFENPEDTEEAFREHEAENLGDDPGRLARRVRTPSRSRSCSPLRKRPRTPAPDALTVISADGNTPWKGVPDRTPSKWSARASSVAVERSRSRPKSPRRRGDPSVAGSEVLSTAAESNSRLPRPEEASTPNSKKFLVSLSNLKTTSTVKLLQCAEDLEKDYKMVDAMSMFEGQWSRREVGNLVTRLQTCSNKLAGIAEGEKKAEAVDLADSLFCASEVIHVLYAFLDEAKQKPTALILKDVSDMQLRKEIESLPSPLAFRLFTGVCSAAILKVTPTNTDALYQLMQFMNFEVKEPKLTLTFASEERNYQSVACQVQVAALTNLLDHMFANFSASEYINAIDSLLKKPDIMPCTSTSHAFAALEKDELTDSSGWSSQALVDLSLAVVMRHVISRHESGTTSRDAKLSTVVDNVLRRKKDISLRLRVFRGTRGREKNLGKWCWDLFESFAGHGGGLSDVAKEAKSMWREIQASTEVAVPIGEEGLERFIEMENTGCLDKVKLFSEMLRDLRECKDADIESGRAALHGMVTSARSVVEFLASNEDMIQMIAKFFNGELMIKDGEASEGNPRADEMELLELLVLIVNFADTVETQLTEQRTDSEALTEFRARVQLLWDALSFHTEMTAPAGDAAENKQTPSQTLKTWSDMNIRYKDIAVGESICGGRNATNALLRLLRSSSFSATISAYVDKHASLATLCAAETVDQNFLAAAMKFKLTLPAVVHDTLDKANAFLLCSQFADKLRGGKKVTIISACQAKVSFEKWLADSGHEMILAMGVEITYAWNNGFKEWLDGASFHGYESAAAVVNLVVQAAESGNFSGCTWVPTQDNEEMAAKLREYQNIWIKLQTTHDVALALQSSLREVLSLKANKDTVDAVILNTSTIMKGKDSMRDNLCVIAYTTLLAANPAPKDFPKRLEKTNAWAKSMSFKTMCLPTYVGNLYRAAMTSKPADEPEKSTSDGAAAAVTPSHSEWSCSTIGTTAITPPRADTKRRFSGASKLLSKK